MRGEAKLFPGLLIPNLMSFSMYHMPMRDSKEEICYGFLSQTACMPFKVHRVVGGGKSSAQELDTLQLTCQAAPAVKILKTIIMSICILLLSLSVLSLSPSSVPSATSNIPEPSPGTSTPHCGRLGHCK